MNKVYEYDVIDKILIDEPSEIVYEKKIKPEFTDLSKTELSEIEEEESHKLIKRCNYDYRLEFEEMSGWIILNKFYGDKELVEPYELIHNSMQKIIDKEKEHQLIKTSKQLEFSYNLSTDIDSTYKYLNPIYLISYSIAQFCNGYIQLNDDSIANDFKMGLYSMDEFKVELKEKYES